MRNLQMLSLTVIGVLLLAASCGGDDAVNANLAPLPSYEFNVFGWCFPPDGVAASLDLSTKRGKAEVFTLEHTVADEASALEIAQRFGMESVTEDTGAVAAFVARGGGGRLYVWKDGTFDYHADIGDRSSFYPPPSKQFVSEKEATRTAEEYLRELGLWPQGVSATVTEVDTGFEVLYEPNGIRRSPLDTAQFISVSVDYEGDVYALEYYWQNVLEANEYPIISEAEALERLRECRGRIIPSGYSMDVIHVELVYLSVPGDGPHDYLIPAYLFEDDTGDLGQKQIAQIPAITDEYLSVPAPSATAAATP